MPDAAAPIVSPRRWWIALLLGLIGAGGLGYLYVGRPWRAALAFVNSIASVAASWHGLAGLLATPLGFLLIPGLAALLAIGFLIDSIRIAVTGRNYRLRWYNGAWVYGGVLAAWLGFAFLPEISGQALDTSIRSFATVSTSMAPTLRIGERAIADMKAYRSRAPEPGDVVVLQHPAKPATYYLDRVIGRPGDTVQMRGGVLHLNGVAVPAEASGSFQLADGYSPRPIPAKLLTETLPNGRKIQVLDLQPNGALDSTAVFTVPAGHYFVMGDNRDNSVDSRLPLPNGLGFVPQANIVGRMGFIYWSPDWSRLGKRID